MSVVLLRKRAPQFLFASRRKSAFLVIFPCPSCFAPNEGVRKTGEENGQIAGSSGCMFHARKLEKVSNASDSRHRHLTIASLSDVFLYGRWDFCLGE